MSEAKPASLREAREIHQAISPYGLVCRATHCPQCELTAAALDSARRAALGQAAEIAEDPESRAGWGTGEGIARAIAAAIRALMEGE